ncbi:MAG: hypothetical protein NUV81_00340 [bacterium]|nr:hypothetical protein [bacterium]
MGLPEKIPTPDPAKELPSMQKREEIEEIEPDEVEYPEENVEKSEADFSIEERKRREKNLEIFIASQSIDKKTFLDPSKLTTRPFEMSLQNVGKFIEGVKKAEDKFLRIQALAKSPETSKKEITNAEEKGRNGISIRTYEGPPPATAYVKAKSNESAFQVDPTDNVVYEVYQVWNEEEKRFETKKKQAPDDLQDFVHRYDQREDYYEMFSTRYDIPAEELPYSLDLLTWRLGVESGSLPIRELAASRINEFIQWDIVPLTVFRQENVGDDLMSVQEAVQATDPEKPPRTLDYLTLTDLLILGPKHPAAKSFMQIACFDYLTNSSDRNTGNIMYDKAGEKFYAIDNGNSMGLTLDLGEGTVMPDIIVSVPYEVALQHEDWQLDDESMQGLRFLTEGINRHLKGESSARDLRYQQLQETFALLFPHEKIASVELSAFAERLNYLIKNRRPPKVQTADNLMPGFLINTLQDPIPKQQQAA